MILFGFGNKLPWQKFRSPAKTFGMSIGALLHRHIR